MSQLFPDIETIVVKVGTTLLRGPAGLDTEVIEALVRDVARVKRERDLRILLVSSGAIGCGMDAMGLEERPVSLPEKQAVAAVGQSVLMHIYEDVFRKHGQGLKTAQVLLSARDLDDRETYLNVRNTISTLFSFGNVVPIVNENDSTATDQLRFGDNDTLAARVASKIGADLLIILSNVDGLYDKDPRFHPDAQLVPRVEAVTPEIERFAGDASAATSVGGMRTKLQAAKIAAATGVPTVVANGHGEAAIHSVLEGANPMTVFGPTSGGMPHRKRWIAFGRAPKGVLQVDDGAREALVNRGTSLLAAGIVNVDGRFEVGEAVEIKDSLGRDVARGLINYSSQDVLSIKGRKSGDIEGILGYKDYDEVIHRDNLVIL